MKKLLVTVAAFACLWDNYAQIPVEIFAGHNQLQHEFFFFKDFDQKQKVNLFSMGRFAVDYEDENLNNSFISSQITYNFTSNWGISTGANYADKDFAPILAVSYTYFNERGDLFINLFPTVIIREKPDYELFGLVFYTPKLYEKWSIFSQLIFGTNINSRFDQHQFSYQQVRLGLGYRDWFQFGAASDHNMIGNGETFLYTNNIGLFVRKEF